MAVDPYEPPRAVRQHLDFAHGGPLRLSTKPGLAACIAVASFLGLEVLTVALLYQPFVARADVMAVLRPMLIVTRILRLASMVSFLWWQHRAVGNVRQLGRQDVSWSPAASVGYWFLPFFNLVHGHRVATELWKSSDPDGLEAGPYAWRTNPSTSLVTWWWLVLLASRLGTVFGPSMLAIVVLVAVEAAAGVLMILVVRGIDQRQAVLARLSYELEEKRERRRLKKLRKEHEAAAKAAAG